MKVLNVWTRSAEYEKIPEDVKEEWIQFQIVKEFLIEELSEINSEIYKLEDLNLPLAYENILRKELKHRKELLDYLLNKTLNSIKDINEQKEIDKKGI